MVKVKGTNNPAAIMTKHVDNETLTRHMGTLELERRKDRHCLNPITAKDEGDREKVEQVREGKRVKTQGNKRVHWGMNPPLP